MRNGLPSEIDLGGRPFAVLREESSGLVLADELGGTWLLGLDPGAVEIVVLDPVRLRRLAGSPN